MNKEFFQQDRIQIYIFAAVCFVLIGAGFAWAYFGDADSVIPIIPATAEATPTAD